jgi:hypothetical protein
MLTEKSYHAAHNRSCASPLRSENYPSPERITAASRLSELWGLQRQFHATTLTVYACRWPANITEICRSNVLDAVMVKRTFEVVRSLIMKQGLERTTFLLMTKSLHCSENLADAMHERMRVVALEIHSPICA